MDIFVKTYLVIFFVILDSGWNSKIMLVMSGLSGLMSTTTKRLSLKDIIISDVTVLSWEAWCKMQPNGFNCKDEGFLSGFYFDLQFGDCKAYPMGKECVHNINNFETLKECHDACKDNAEHPVLEKIAPSVYCHFQPEFGTCNSYYPRYYFDVTYRVCKGFAFSGCGGNLNRFSTPQDCTAVCMSAVEYN